jgi:phasin family protein
MAKIETPKPVAKTVTTPVKPAVKPVASKAAVIPASVIPNADAAPAPTAPKAAVAPMSAAPLAVAAAAPASPKETTMNETINQVEDTLKTSAAQAGEKATEMFKDAQDRAKAAFEKSGEVAKDVLEFHKANLEAVVESGRIAVKGAQTAAQNAADYSRKNWDATTAFVKSAAAVRAPTDFFKLQGDFVRGQFDSAVAEFSKSSEFYLKLAGEVAQPIQNRISAANEQIKSRLAA